MYLSIIFLPLFGSIVAGFFGRKVGVSGAQLITTSCVVIATVLAVLAFIEVGINNVPVSIHLFRWIDSEWLCINWGFHFDSLTVAMLLPVLIISSLVHVYSISYMQNDPHVQRFFSYLSLFTFMMLILVTGNNYLLMFVGWEGVGVCSYLLVNFWFTRIAANTSAISAFLTNRVGDWILTVGMFTVAWTFGNLDYATVFSLAPYINEDVITIIGVCFLIGAMAKSAQVGLHVWLPMAMEGPTPVSALIHAATMVTAGVYLLMRSSPLIEYCSTVLLLCLWLGAITTIFSSLVGLFQQDLKKVIAFSTMSQLGMMVIAVGLSSYNVALFHLISHAFYKALLFLGAGSVIHAVADNQDFRRYGGLINYLPLTYSVMLIASLSLVAFPFMAGFYSKDFILESAFGQFTFSGIAVYIIATIGAIFTTLYSVKVLYLTFLTSPNGSRRYFGYFFKKKLHLTEDEVMEFDKILAMRHERENLYTHITGKTMLMSKYEWRDNVYFHALKSAPKVWINYWVKKYLSFRNVKALSYLSTRPIILPVLLSEGNVYMTLPLVILAIFSIFFGFLAKDLFLGLGSNLLAVDNSIFIHPNHEIVIDTEFGVPTIFKLLPFFCTIIFSVLSIIVSEYYPESLINFKFSRLGYNIFGLFNQRFLIEMFYNKYITNLVLNLGGQTTKVLDKGSIEFLGPFGLEKALIKLSKNISSLSTSIVTSYALYILLGLISYLAFYSLNTLILYLVLLIILMIFLVIAANYDSLSIQSNNKSFARANTDITSPLGHPQPLGVRGLESNSLSYISGLMLSTFPYDKPNTSALSEVDVDTSHYLEVFTSALSEVDVDISPYGSAVFISWEVLFLTLGVILVLVLSLILYKKSQRIVYATGVSINNRQEWSRLNQDQLEWKLREMILRGARYDIYSRSWNFTGINLSRAEKIRLATIGRIAEETGELTRNGMRVSSFGQIIYKVNKKKVKSSHCIVDIVRTYSPSLPS